MKLQTFLRNLIGNLIAMALLTFCNCVATGNAHATTNSVTPSAGAVMVGTNGALSSPVNFFSANSKALAFSINGLVNLIPTNAVLSAGIGPLGENAYQLPFNLTNNVVYLIVSSTDGSGDSLETSDAATLLPTPIGGFIPRMTIFTNLPGNSQPWFISDSYSGLATNNQPVRLRLFVYPTNGINTNLTMIGTFLGDFSGRAVTDATNLLNLAPAVSNVTSKLYTGITQSTGVGSVLIPQLMSGPGPVTIFRTGDSMASDSFYSTLTYFTALLRYEYGNAGSYCMALDVSYNPSFNTRFNTFPSISPKILTTALGGYTIYASDGTNACRASQTNGGVNIPVNAIGFWYWAQSNGGNFVANYTNSAANGSVTLSGFSATPKMLHTNIPITLGTNCQMYFTSLVGTNYIVGWDNVNTNSTGVADMIWAHGGYELYNVISLTNLGTNSFNTIFSVVKPSLLMLEARNNGIEGIDSLSNQVYQLSLVAITNNPGCSVVTVCPPSPTGSSGPSSVGAWENLAGALPPSRSDSPFFNIRLNYVYENLRAVTNQVLGIDPHPTLIGGQVSGTEVYRQLGFMRPPGSYPLFNGNNPNLVSAQGLLGSPVSRADLASLLSTNGNGSALTGLTGSQISGALSSANISSALNSLGLYPRTYRGNGNAASISSGSARYWPLFGGVGQTAAGNGLADQPAGLAETYSNFVWQVNFTTAPANGLVITYYVNKNDVPSTVTASITGDGTSTNFNCSDLTHTLAVAAGDKLNMVATNNSGSSLSPGAGWYFKGY